MFIKSTKNKNLSTTNISSSTSSTHLISKLRNSTSKNRKKLKEDNSSKNSNQNIKNSGEQQDLSQIPVPRNDLFGKKFKIIKEQFPILLPGYHDAILSVGHKGMIIIIII